MCSMPRVLRSNLSQWFDLDWVLNLITQVSSDASYFWLSLRQFSRLTLVALPQQTQVNLVSKRIGIKPSCCLHAILSGTQKHAEDKPYAQATHPVDRQA